MLDWTAALSHFISRLPEGVPGNDVHPADAAPSLPQPAAGSDPAEAASPHAPAGTHLSKTITNNEVNSWKIIVWHTIRDKHVYL